jgi:hypothetical protein
MPRPQLLYAGKDLVPIVQEAGWATGLVWTDEENCAPSWIQSLDHQACSKSLYDCAIPAHSLLGSSQMGSSLN